MNGDTPVSIAAEKFQNHWNSLFSTPSLLTIEDENGWMPIMWILNNKWKADKLNPENPDIY